MIAVAVAVALTAGCGSENGDGDGDGAEPTGSAAPEATAEATDGAATTTQSTAAPSTDDASAGTTEPTDDTSPVDTAATADPAAVTLDDATRTRLQDIFDEQFEQSGMPGAAAALWIGDQQWTSVQGVSDVESLEPFRIDDFVRIASITKTFTGTAVLELVADGQISLDDTLDMYVSDIPNGDQITVREMLNMSSGIHDFTENEEFTDAWTADPTMAWTPEQTLELIKDGEPEFAPGAKTQYADSNYFLLGLIVEEVTGQPIGEVITERVIDPLDLPFTSYPTDDTIPAPHPTGYLPDPDDPSKQIADVTVLNPSVAGAAGAMISTVDDLRTWAIELAEGSLLPPELQAERLEFEVFDGMNLNFGYGLGVLRLNDLVGHNGAIMGYSSVVFRYPDADATLVVVGNASTNETTPTTEIALSLIQALYPDQIQ